MNLRSKGNQQNNMNFRPLSILQIWSVLSRTRPCTPLPRQRPFNRPPRGIWGILDGGFWYLIYQGIGVTAPFGLCYVVGVVVGGIGGEGIMASILIAMVASLLTGLCYAELITSSRECSENASTAIYQLVGEFPAYCAAYLNVLISCACFATMSKALSSTMEELSHERLSRFLSNILGNLPISGLPPDVLAFGAALVTSVLLACGLKQAGALRTAMNIFSLVGFIFFLSVGGSYTRSSPSIFKVEPGPRQIFAGAGICCCLFHQFLELGRRSKGQFRANLKLPLAISFTAVFVLLSFLGLGVVLYLMMDDRSPVSGAPLLRALQLRDVGWARFVMGSIQIIIISLGIGESGEIICRHLVGMAYDGFIPSFLSLECPLAFSHSRAHLLGGIAASVLALFLTHVYLLEFLATNILLLNVLIILATLYRPFRCIYDSLCSVAVTPSSKRIRLSSSSMLRPNKTSSKSSNQTRTIHFLKNGIRVLAFPESRVKPGSKDDELEIPLLSSPDHMEDPDNNMPLSFSDENDAHENLTPQKQILEFREDFNRPRSTHIEAARASSPLIECKDDTGLSFVEENSTVKTISAVDNNESELIHLNESPNSSEESEEEGSRQLEEFVPEEDIDAIVSEYKEQLRISSVGTRINALPTKTTARRAFLCILGLVFISLAVSIFSLNVTMKMDSRPDLNSALRTVFVLASFIIIFALLIFLTQLPTTKPLSSSEPSFRIICSSWISFIALFLNIFLITELFSRAVWITFPFHISAVIWYATYSSRHSAVATSHLCKGLNSHGVGGKENEMVCLSPTVPTSVYASRPQREGLNRNI